MFDGLFKLIDPAKFGFRDKCSKDAQRGIGVLCGIYIVISFTYMLSLGTMIIVSFTSCRKNMNTTSMIKIALYSIIAIFWQIFIIIFMINSCKMCNGLYGFLFLMVLGAIFSFFTWLLFGNISNIIAKCMMDKWEETKL